MRHHANRSIAMHQRIAPVIACLITLACCAAPRRAHAADPITKTAKITLDESGALVVDGKKVFPITLTITPGPDAKAPDGRHAYQKMADDGAMFMRTGKPDWNPATIDLE